MKIILPMAGFGQRFLDAGFTDIKPLIKINGKAIIEHIIDMFPKDSDFVFIINEGHVETTPLVKILKAAAPKALVIPIAPHKKGPVYTCLAAMEQIDDNDEVFVNYCDLINQWDFDDFLKRVRRGGYDGAMPAFKGFHPASLGDTFYAYMKVNERNELIKIREKASFTDNRMEEFASAGGYYFAKARLMKKYFKKIVDEELSTSGEYYASVPYNYMVDDGYSVLVYPLDKHIVLGTPYDYHTYVFWSDYFHNHNQNSKKLPLHLGEYLKEDVTTVIPLAGRKDQFFIPTHELPKPLIPVHKQPMMISSLKTLPRTNHLIVATLAEYDDNYNIEYTLTKEFPNAKVIQLKESTEGMASTCLAAKDFIDAEKPLLISGADYSLEFDETKLKALLDDKSIDVIMFTHKNHNYERHNPFLYTYLKVNDATGQVEHISEKAPISNTPYNDNAYAGVTFYRKGKFFLESASKMIRKEKRVKGQFFVASSANELIEAGVKVVPFEVKRSVSWGKEVNLKEFTYWQDYFSNASAHPFQKPTGTIV